MLYRRLGKSGLQVSLLSFGSWVTFGNQIDDTTSEALMKKAYDSGVNFFDNAEIYGSGQSEVVMGRILKKMAWDRTSYLVSSKVFFGRGGKLPNQTGLSRKHVIEACNEALTRLQVDYLDLYFAHRPDKNTPIEETVWAMNTLLQQGKILYWGTSEWSAQEIMEAHMIARELRLIAPTMDQVQYNMFCRQKVEADYLQVYKTVGLGTTIWSPLASGLLSGRYLNEVPQDSRLARPELSWLREKTLVNDQMSKVERLKTLADRLGVSLAQFAIAWCAQNPNVSTVILGASRLSQLEENLGALEVLPYFTEELNKQVEKILENKPLLPQY
ncbi:MAG: aldo/keto reductase [Saprospiraceae bacterium]|jgi:voltage-dependent potassium channel beta subunit|nr:aldo/keto reductase [Saprospiraceae bacterium]MBL0261984.1 aldo/keto reductase [Saprospiraceae bacterium]